MPLIGLTAHEPIEILKAHPAGPLVKGSGQAVEIGRRVMILAEPGSGVAVVLQDRADGGFVLVMMRIVARIAGRHVRRSHQSPTEWWLRPVISAARVGEQSAVEWNCV